MLEGTLGGVGHTEHAGACAQGGHHARLHEQQPVG